MFSFIPVGTIVPYAGSIDPDTYIVDSGTGLKDRFGPLANNNTGWILCDGSMLNQSQFSTLFNVIGYTYGGSKDSGKFMIPNYRGYFLRGVALTAEEDPGLADPPEPEDKRTQATNGSENGVGSTQNFSVEMHEHEYTHYPAVGTVQGQVNAEAGNVKEASTNTTKLFDGQGTEVKGKETRPKNIYVNYLIYAGEPNA
ncbi:MAG: phage tail protein [Bacteroidia bacterium]